MVNGRHFGFALRYWETYPNKPAVLVWEELLPTTNMRKAQNAFRRKDEELRALDATTWKRIEDADQRRKAEPSLVENQLLCLSRPYPRTVELLRQGGSAEETFQCYQIETLALAAAAMGLSKSAFQQARKALLDAARRQYSRFDEIGFELVAGWKLRYQAMTPADRAAALKSLGFGSHSPEAIRKKCERLRLPPARRRGAPKK
jgi:hypothetical protein